MFPDLAATSVIAAVSTGLAMVAVHGLPIRPEAAHRFHAPVRGRVVRVVELVLVGIDDRHHVHALVTEVITRMLFWIHGYTV